MPVLERQSSLEVLRGALADAEAGAGSMVLVAGEAGIGKTALVSLFTDEVRDRVEVLTGACDDLHAPAPFGPWHDIARVSGGELAAALSAEADPARALNAIVALASDRTDPVVLAIEDVQWADDATLDSLGYLAGRVSGLPAVVVLTYRPEDLTVDHPLVGLLGRLHGDAFRRLTLEPLTESAVAELAGETAVDARALHRITGGNPFFIREALAAPGTTVPATVRDAVLSRLHPLTDGARDLISVTAVAPGGLDHDVVAGLSADALLYVSEAEEHGILEGDENRVRFHTEMARRAVEQSLTEAARRDLHGRVLASLLSIGAEPSRLLHHAVAAGNTDLIMQYAPEEAARCSASGAHRQAATWREAVLAHGDRLEPAERAQMLHDYAVELHRLHRLDEAVAAAERSVAEWEGLDDATGLGRALIELARDQYFMGETETARATTQRAIEVLEEGGDDEALAAAYSSLAALYVWRHRMVDVLPWGERAARLARAVGRLDTLSQALNYLGVAKVLTGDETGFDDLAEAVATAKRIGEADYHSRGVNNLATALFSNLRYAEGVEVLQEAIPDVAAAELVSHEYNMRALLGQGLLILGRWDEAEAELRPLVERAAGDLVAAPSYGYLGRLLLRRGEREGDELIDRGLAIPGIDESLLRYGAVATAAMERAWLSGDTATAAEIHRKVTTMAAEVESLDWVGTVTLYAARAGLDVSPPDPCPPSFEYGILGDWERAAAEWEKVGDRYEQAVELVRSGREDPGLSGVRLLENLGAARTVAWAREHLGA